MDNENNSKEVLINGKSYTLQELEEIKKDPKKKLILDEDNRYHLLERMQG